MVSSTLKYFRSLFKNELVLIGTFLFLVFYFAALFVYLIEQSSNPQFQTFADGLWWSIVTVATVGYGDKAPITGFGRIVASLTIVGSVVLVSLFTATISSLFVARKIKESQGLNEVNLKNHLLICGWNNNVENLLARLNSSSKKNSKLPVALVNDISPEKIEGLLSNYSNLELQFTRGDHSKELILERGNIKEAKSVVILPDNLNPSGLPSDDKTLSTLITIKGISPKTKVFVHIMNSENYQPLKRANADEVIVSDQYVDFFLANHVINPGTAELTLDLLNGNSENDIQRIQIPKKFIGKTFEELFIDFKKEKNITVIGIVVEEESVGLEQLISHDLSAIDQFIERKFQEAGVNVSEKTNMRISINPLPNYIIQEKDLAIVIGSIS
ncbi:MAG: ion channel [Bacteroidetes bacterium]|nr:ion channel [Bacteroidota bacterium]